MTNPTNDGKRGGGMLTACKLWRRTSAKGAAYLAGRMGGLRVLVMENRDRAGDDDASHVLLVAEATDREGGR